MLALPLLLTIPLLSLGLSIRASPPMYERGPAPSPSPLPMAQVFRTCTVPGTVALTFDDGPYIFGTDLITTLNKANVKATFFLNGNNWACIYNPQMSTNVKLAYDTGHQLASHTWAHKNLTYLTWDQIQDEMAKTEQAIQRITGALVAFVRPPYGAYNDLVLQAIKSRGQNAANWDFDSQDSLSVPPAQQKAAYDALINEHRNTVLSLQHEVQNSTVYEMVPYVIDKFRTAGYKFVTVADCLGMKPYQSVGQPGVRDANWKC